MVVRSNDDRQVEVYLCPEESRHSQQTTVMTETSSQQCLCFYFIIIFVANQIKKHTAGEMPMPMLNSDAPMALINEMVITILFV
jgi:hypothetical protein